MTTTRTTTSISDLELDRDVGFLREHQENHGPWPRDDGNEEEDVEDNNKEDDNNKDNNDEKGISALGLDKDLGFSRGHQGQQPHDDDDEEEDKDKVEDNNKSDDNNNKDDTDDTSIIALGLDRDLRFL